VVLVDVVSEHQGGDGGELDQDVDGWAGGVLERISNCVTDNSSNVHFSELGFLSHPWVELDILGVVLIGVLSKSFEFYLGLLEVNSGSLSFLSVDRSLSLDFLLGVIPGSTSV